MQKDLKIVSLNMFGSPFHPQHIIRSFMRNNVRRRFRASSAVLNSINADILILQEVLDFPHLIYLKRLLSEFPYVIYKKSLYGPRGGLVIFSKIPLERAHYHDFVERGKIHNKSISGLLSLKGILKAKIKDTNIVVINTHLNQNSDHDWSLNNRYVPILISQLKQLAIYTWSILEHEDKIILAGDFNMPKDTPYYKDFIKQANLFDIFKNDSFSTYHLPDLPKEIKVGRIDYIFASSSFAVRDKTYILREQIMDESGKLFFASDHMGLVATFSLT